MHIMPFPSNIDGFPIYYKSICIQKMPSHPFSDKLSVQAQPLQSTPTSGRRPSASEDVLVPNKKASPNVGKCAIHIIHGVPESYITTSNQHPDSVWLVAVSYPLSPSNILFPAGIPRGAISL